MTISRRIARPLLASMFIAGGVDAIQHPDGKAKKAESVALPVAEQLGLPEDPVQLVRINGAVQVGAGTLLAVGKLPRLASTALIGSLIPTTAAGHRFWEETDERARTMQRTQFLKNLAMLGGLILAAADTDGRPSMSWRAKRAKKAAAERLRQTQGDASDRTRHAFEHALEDAATLGRQLGSEAATRGKHLGSEAATRGKHLRSEAATRGKHLGSEAATRGMHLGSEAAELARQALVEAEKRTREARREAKKRAARAKAEAEKKTRQARQEAEKRTRRARRRAEKRAKLAARDAKSRIKDLGIRDLVAAA